MKYLVSILILFYIFSSCKENHIEDDLRSIQSTDKKSHKDFFEKKYLYYSSKTEAKTLANEVGFSAKILSGLDFVRRKNEVISDHEAVELKDEKIVLLEIELMDKNKEFFDSHKVNFSRSEINQYLVGNILNDLTLNTKNEKYKPIASSYEGIIGEKNKMRIFFFFGKIPNVEINKVEYFDKLTNAGKINFKFY